MQVPRNIGGLVTGKHTLCSGTATAGSTGDNAEVYSASGVDCADAIRSGSAILRINYTPALTADKTLSFTINRTQCATSGGSYSDPIAVLAKTAVATGASTTPAVYDISLDTSSWLQYQKFYITPDLSHTTTDTVQWGATLIYADPSA